MIHQSQPAIVDRSFASAETNELCVHAIKENKHAALLQSKRYLLFVCQLNFLLAVCRLRDLVVGG